MGRDFAGAGFGSGLGSGFRLARSPPRAWSATLHPSAPAHCPLGRRTPAARPRPFAASASSDLRPDHRPPRRSRPRLHRHAPRSRAAADALADRPGRHRLADAGSVPRIPLRKRLRPRPVRPQPIPGERRPSRPASRRCSPVSVPGNSRARLSKRRCLRMRHQRDKSSAKAARATSTKFRIGNRLPVRLVPQLP